MMEDYTKTRDYAANVLIKGLGKIFEFSGDIFSGSTYKDNTRLKAGRLKRNIFTSPITFGKLKPIFIVGFNLLKSNVFYELWYLPFHGKYIVVDNFGKRIIQPTDRLTDAVESMVDIISTMEPDQFVNYSVSDEETLRLEKKKLQRKEKQLELKRLEKEIDQEAEKNLKKKGTSSRNLDNDDFEDFDYEDEFEFESYSINDVDMILEASLASRDLLADMINSDIKEYRESRMSRNKMSSLWKLILGRDVVLPNKFIGGIGSKILKLVGRDREAFFVIGFTLDNKIDVEIWFVKSVQTGRGSFFVFDITSAKLLAKNLKTIREAYSAIANKLSVKFSKDI